MKSILIGSRPLGPLGVVSLPVVVGGEVDPDVVPDEGDDAPVGHPRDPRLEVVHDSQLLGGPLVVIAGEVRDADSLPSIQITSLDILHLHNRGAIHVTNKTEISKFRKCFSKYFYLSSYFSFSSTDKSITVKGTNLSLRTMYFRCFSKNNPLLTPILPKVFVLDISGLMQDLPLLCSGNLQTFS